MQAVRVMLDIRVIRENPEEVKARLKPRSGEAWKLVDDVLACDEARRNAETEKQALQSERNATSKQIGMLKKKGRTPPPLKRACVRSGTASGSWTAWRKRIPPSSPPC